MKPQKIFEISGEDWTKGLSFKSDFPVGGVYSVASKFDPFDNYGYFHTSLDYAIVSTTTDTPICITSWNNSGTAKLYVHTATKLYEVLDGSPYTQSDKSAEIDVSPDFRGAIIYKNKYVYSQTTELRANALPVALASDIQILSGYASSEHYHPMCIAPNKKLYIADGNQLNEVTSVAGTTGNTAGKYLLEDNLIVRDLLNDGNYLVVIADSNSSHTATATGVRGKYRSVILFYDVNSGRPTADVIYEFSDSWLTSVKQLDGALYIFGKDNLYICNAATPPKAIFSFDGDSTITEAPRTPFEVIVKGNSILWSGQNNGVIWAYGSLVSGQKRFFTNHTLLVEHQERLFGLGQISMLVEVPQTKCSMYSILVLQGQHPVLQRRRYSYHQRIVTHIQRL